MDPTAVRGRGPGRRPLRGGRGRRGGRCEPGGPSLRGRALIAAVFSVVCLRNLPALLSAEKTWSENTLNAQHPGWAQFRRSESRAPSPQGKAGAPVQARHRPVQEGPEEPARFNEKVRTREGSENAQPTF